MVASSVVVPDGTVGPDLSALLAEPASSLRRGGLVAFPTETVYGLGADAMSSDAVGRIFVAKGRPADNPLIVHIPDSQWLTRLVSRVTPLARDMAERHWPGPLTMVLDAGPDVPSVTTGGLSTVAVRIPADPLARRLIELAGTPVAAPSANISGRPSPTTAHHVLSDLGDRIDWVIDGGPCDVGIESTVVDVRGALPVVLREGAITREMLGQLGLTEDGIVRAPGNVHPHYRPTAAVVIATPGTAARTASTLAGRQAVGLVGPDDADLSPGVVVLATPLGAQELAAVLYAALREADTRGLATVVVEAVPDDGLGRAVMDRLRRAGGMIPD